MLSPGLDKSLTNIAPGPEQIDRVSRIRAAAKAYGEAIEQNEPSTRERSLAITNLEQSLMWAIKAVVLETPAKKEG